MPGQVLAQLIQSGLHEKNHPQVLNFQKHQITRIGILPNQVSEKVHVLNLKNNQLKNIEGIQQFKSLQSLDLSNNKISSSQGILAIKELPNLKRLYLKGNPFLQNPLPENILAFLNSFENDLYVLNYAFVNESRQELIRQHKRCKSQSKSKSPSSKTSEKLQIKNSKSQESELSLEKSIEINKHIQTNKAKILLKSMKEFIEEGHESQEMSSEEINCETTKQESIMFIEDDHTFGQKLSENTPMRKNPQFSSLIIEDQTFSGVNQETKFQEDSTGVKGKNISKQKTLFLDDYSSSKFQIPEEKFTEQKSSMNKSEAHVFRRSRGKEFKYQVDNLNIKMDLDSANLNCPSIIEKEDHDSYEIQFDFMSPGKQSKNKLISLQSSPSKELKQITAEYMKIQEDEITLSADEKPKPKSQFLGVSKSPKIETTRVPNSSTLRNIINSKNQNRQQKSIPKRQEKENIIENFDTKKQEPILSKRGSLHENTRHLLPQTNETTGNDLISKILPNKNIKSHNESLSFATGTSLQQMIENGEKFEKFYYNSLTKLKPVFSLLYSPLSSLKADEKDLLLQELFKNHKQIFILFIREFHAKQKLQDELNSKLDQINAQNDFRHQLTEKVEFLGEKLNDYKEKCDHLQSIIGSLQGQNAKLNKEAHQFHQIFATREKLINDVQIEYQKANKINIKKDHLIQKFLNQDQIEEQIEKNHQNMIKRQFLDLVNKKASKVMKLHQFEIKKKQKQQKIQQRKNNQLKNIVFEAFLKNYHKQKRLKEILARTNFNMLNDFFYEWKTEANLSRATAQVQKLTQSSQKKEFFQASSNFSLIKRRNRKIKNFYLIRTKRKVFLEGFKKFALSEKTHQKQSLTKAMQFNIKNILKQYFQKLKISKSILNQKRDQKESKLRPMILKMEFNLLRRLVNFQNKEEEFLLQQTKENAIKCFQSKLMLKIMKLQCTKKIQFRKGLKIAVNYRLKRLFKAFKSITCKSINKQRKLKPIIKKLAQQQRLKTLVVKFRQIELSKKIQKKQKESFFESFQQFHLIKTKYSMKSIELQSFLNFRQGFKAKNIFISTLRHMNVLRKMKSKELTLNEHYQMQDLKYKQGHELNMFTLDQLKSEIATYLNEIQCYKVQVQILSQREQFILDQKENCLLEMQYKEEENLELKAILIENEKRLQELQKKYQKSLDMYAAAMEEASKKSLALQKGKTSFLYDTIAGSRLPATFRKDDTETNFTSLKR